MGKKHVGLVRPIKSKFTSVKTKVRVFKGTEHTSEERSFFNVKKMK